MVVLFVGGVPLEDVGYVLREVIILWCCVGWGCWAVSVIVWVCHPLQAERFPRACDEPAAHFGDGDD